MLNSSTNKGFADLIGEELTEFKCQPNCLKQ